tara:strand:+ start:2401 stop:2679 length:279 start_codon:yes stop_codon:yes gene_type:complete
MTFTMCIPRVHKSINKEKVKKVFEQYNFGDLYKIVILENNYFNKVFIHYNSLYNNKNTQLILKMLDENKYFNIIYEKPWFWKCYKFHDKSNR